jgi:phosphatidylcholine synthase
MPSPGWLAHLYTALGAPLALVATIAVIRDDFRTAFLVLALTTFIDATDGALARALHVKDRLPAFDGGRLDDIVDYLTYVFVPVLLIWRAGLLPPGWDVWVGGAVLVASAYGFVQPGAKIEAGDHFFTGFPSYWNIVSVYLYVWRWPALWNAVVLVVLAVLVFVPIRYVYPSRTVTLARTTLTLGTAWAVLIVVMMWRLPATDGPWMWLSLVFPAYYAAVSLWLHRRDITRSPVHQITK